MITTGDRSTSWFCLAICVCVVTAKCGPGDINWSVNYYKDSLSSLTSAFVWLSLWWAALLKTPGSKCNVQNSAMKLRRCLVVGIKIKAESEDECDLSARWRLAGLKHQHANDPPSWYFATARWSLLFIITQNLWVRPYLTCWNTDLHTHTETQSENNTLAVGNECSDGSLCIIKSKSRTEIGFAGTFMCCLMFCNQAAN